MNCRRNEFFWRRFIPFFRSVTFHDSVSGVPLDKCVLLDFFMTACCRKFWSSCDYLLDLLSLTTLILDEYLKIVCYWLCIFHYIVIIGYDIKTHTLLMLPTWPHSFIWDRDRLVTLLKSFVRNWYTWYSWQTIYFLWFIVDAMCYFMWLWFVKIYFFPNFECILVNSLI